MRAPWLLAIAALSGCFYVNVINVAPVARIRRVGTDPVYPGGMVMLTAVDSEDADGDSLTYEWQCEICQGFSTGGGMFKANAPSHVPLRVQLTATDPHGATGETTLVLDVADRAPEATVRVQTLPNDDGTYTVTRPIVFAADGKDPDGDGLAYSFALHPPPQSDPNKANAVRNGQLYTVTPDVPGRWEVEVLVTDGYGMMAVARESVTVAADGPPCLAAVSPGWSPDSRIVVARGDGPSRFAVESVTDDLDGYPGSGIRFRWLVAGPGDGAPVELEGHDLPDLTLDPADLEPGDLLDVRVEIEDRNDRPLPCAIDQPACSIGGNACLQRLTWTVEVR